MVSSSPDWPDDEPRSAWEAVHNLLDIHAVYDMFGYAATEGRTVVEGMYIAAWTGAGRRKAAVLNHALRAGGPPGPIGLGLPRLSRQCRSAILAAAEYDEDYAVAVFCGGSAVEEERVQLEELDLEEAYAKAMAAGPPPAPLQPSLPRRQFASPRLQAMDVGLHDEVESHMRAAMDPLTRPRRLEELAEEEFRCLDLRQDDAGRGRAQALKDAVDASEDCQRTGAWAADCMTAVRELSTQCNADCADREVWREKAFLADGNGPAEAAAQARQAIALQRMWRGKGESKLLLDLAWEAQRNRRKALESARAALEALQKDLEAEEEAWELADEYLQAEQVAHDTRLRWQEEEGPPECLAGECAERNPSHADCTAPLPFTPLHAPPERSEVAAVQPAVDGGRHRGGPGRRGAAARA